MDLPDLPSSFPSFPDTTSYISPETAKYFPKNQKSTIDQLKEEFPGFYNNACYETLATHIDQTCTYEQEKNKKADDQIERIIHLVTQLVLELKK
jgi:hypothetical protein